MSIDDGNSGTSGSARQPGASAPARQPIVVQLDAYSIPDDHLVWKCSPGKTYRFYGVVRDAEVVFPDVRGLGEFCQSDEWDDNKVLSIIAADRWSRELESRARSNKPKPGSGSVNSTDRTNLTYLKRLLFEAKKGDFVVVPAEGYDKEILFGEFLTDAGSYQQVEATDGDYTGQYVGRPVRWRRRTIKRELPTDLIDSLHYRAAVFVLPKDRAEDVYREVLGNFVFQKRYVSEFRTDKEKFTPEDFAVVSTWLNGFDFLRHEMSEGGSASLPDKLTFAKMGLERVPDSDATELKIDIQSPGEIFAKSVGPFALALTAMMTLSGCGAAEAIDNGITIEMKSIGNDSGNCRIEVEKAVNSMVRTMSYERLNDANCLGERAIKDAGIQPGARLKSGPRRSN